MISRNDVNKDADGRTAGPAPAPRGLVPRVARFTVAHRRLTVLAWVVVMLAAVGVSTAAGSRYTNNNSLPGTEAQRALDLLHRDFPGQAGDIDQIVFHVSGEQVTDASVRSRIAPMLATVARLPHVTAVLSPYTPAGATQIGRAGHTAFATITFDERANALPAAAIKKVITVAEAARSPRLHVELGGQAIEQLNTVSAGPATGVGILAAIVILLIAFGSAAAVGLPIVTALLGLGTALGLITLASHLLSMPTYATELAAMLGLGVGIDYALFIVTRFRAASRGGASIRDAVLEAMSTAGRAVLFAGATVVVALIGMVVLGIGFLTGLAVSSAIAVLVTMLAAVTLLPALLTMMGRRIDRRERAGRSSRGRAQGRLWARWARVIRRHPRPAAAAGLVIMLAVAAPALSVRLGISDAGNDPPGQTTRQAYDLLGDAFGPGFNGPLVVVARFPHAPDAAALRQVSAAVGSTPDVRSVTAPRLSADGRTAVYEAYPASAPQAAATTTLVNAVRQHVLPPVAKSTGATVLVGGATAINVDFTHVLSGKLPLFVAIVVAIAALLLLAMFRSWVIPIQAAVMNLLSVAAALGVVVAVFQHGFLGRLVGVKAGPIETWLPVLLFAIVFGLSMDYEVFLVSRIREQWTRHGGASEAVTEGITSTGRVITAAAAIMICVFVSFVLTPDRAIKLFGLSLAAAVFLDAFVIRMLLLPAVLEITGPRTWRFPRSLDRHLPRLGAEHPPALRRARAAVTPSPHGSEGRKATTEAAP